MSYLDFKNYFNYRLNMTRLCLVISFLILFFSQLMIGIKEIEDLLVIVIFFLFINDVVYKYRHPNSSLDQSLTHEERSLRKKVTWVLFVIMLLPTLLELFNLSSSTKELVFKIAFILWAQVFLVDAVLNYKATHLKKWLLYSHTAAVIVLVFALL